MSKLSHTERFMTLFSGYTKAHGTYDARMLGSLGKQKPMHRKVDSTPSPTTFKNHLDGQCPLGIYLLDDHEMVRFAAIDIDVYPVEHAKISRQLKEWGLPFVVCNSKSGGAHAYVFFVKPEGPARVIAELRRVSAALGYPDAEVFPKQVKRPPGGYGNYINLPFFAHPKLSYNCWDGDQQLGLDRFLDLAESRLNNLAALSAAIAQADLVPRGVSIPPTTNHAISGRNDFLFRFGCSVQDAVEDQAALLAMLLQKNSVATEADHPNFGTAGPLPTDEVERLCESVIAQKEKEQKSGVKQVVGKFNRGHAHAFAKITSIYTAILSLETAMKHLLHSSGLKRNDILSLLSEEASKSGKEEFFLGSDDFILDKLTQMELIKLIDARFNDIERLKPHNKDYLLGELNNARKIRNDLMHFRKLEQLSEWLTQIESVTEKLNR